MSHSPRQANYLDPFVDLEWVQANRDQVIIADARWYLDGSSGGVAYQSGHIPGAVFVDLDLWLSAPSGPGGLNPLPDPSVFAHGMGLLGIGDDSTVIAYDDAGGVIAARLVWMLRSIGKRAALLDGGLAAWQGTLETEAASLRPVEFSVAPWPTSLVVSADVVDRWAGPVLDARNPDRFHGSLQVSSDPQPGHIPSAVNVPCRRNVDATGRLLPVDQLREAFSRAGVTDGAEVISYCGSGVTACHTLLAMEHAGLGVGRLYPGGWSEYAALSGRTAEV